ncbi:MAG: glycosyltransferase family 4 protein [Nitrospirae bacterium]|nr:glycosyltransferase family 4 protein [Nitrospirota bacterium]
MKRVAILNGYNPDACSGGIETFTLGIKSLLEDYNYDVDCFYIQPKPNIKTMPFPFKSFNKLLPQFLLDCFMLGRAFSDIDINYDLVISNNFYGLGYLSPRVKAFNIYHSAHAGYADALKGRIDKGFQRELKWLYGHIGDRLSGRNKIKVAVSGNVKDELQRLYKFKDIIVVNHGIDTNFFRRLPDTQALRRKWNIPVSAFAGVFAGRWEAGKGIDIMESVIKLHPDIFWLLVVGQTECRLNGDNIRVIRDAGRETMRELYSLSDFMLFPSYYEGFGFVIIEAMACEVPVICAKVGAAKDLSSNNGVKELIIEDIHNKDAAVAEIQSILSRLKSDSAFREEVKSAGRALVERQYNIENWRREMSAVFGL